jgi:hypothetical protein
MIWVLGHLAAIGDRRRIGTGRVRCFTIEELRLRAAERAAMTQQWHDRVADAAPRSARPSRRFVREADARPRDQETLEEATSSDAVLDQSGARRARAYPAA